MKRDVHGVAVVQAPAIVNRALTKDRNRELSVKRVCKKSLHFPGFAEVPAGAAGETNEGRRAHQSLPGKIEISGELLVGIFLDQYPGDLIVSAGHLAPSLCYFLFGDIN